MAFGYYPYQNNGYQQAPQPQPQNQGSGLVWVQGETGAKSYLMAPNTTALLMDSEASRMYIKSTDGTGMPSMRVFEYKEINPQAVPTADYVTKAEFDEFRTKMQSLFEKKEEA